MTAQEVAAGLYAFRLGMRGYWLAPLKLPEPAVEVRYYTDDDPEKMESTLIGVWTGTLAGLCDRLAELDWPEQEVRL